jgi:purine-cytosine permease-like protein
MSWPKNLFKKAPEESGHNPGQLGQSEVMAEDLVPRDLNVTTGESHDAVGEGRDSIGQVESRGVDYIPDIERNSSPRTLFWAFEGPQFSLGSYIFGGVMVAAGLDWWAVVVVTLLGVGIGSLILGFDAIIGPRTGTNGGVSSGAFFGVRGRYLGSFLAEAGDLGFNVFTLWPAALATMVAMHRLAGWPQNTLWLCIWMGVIGAICCFVSILGHATLVVAYKWTAIVSVVVLGIYMIMIGHNFRTHFPHTTYLFSSYWRTWLFALTVCIVGPITYGIVVNDYTRRISGITSPKKVFWALFSSVYSGTVLAYLFGAFTVLCVKKYSPSLTFPAALSGLSPFWFLIPIVILAVIGNAIGGGINIYNSSLDLHTILWRLSRFQNAMIITLLSFAVTYLCVVVWNVTNFISTLVDLVSASFGPWIAIMVIGHFRTRQRYRPIDLHSYTTPEHRGIYWYKKGFEPRALVIWAISVTIAILCSSSTDLVGPISRHFFDSIDLSFLAGLLSATVLYLLFAPKPPMLVTEAEEVAAQVPTTPAA